MPSHSKLFKWQQWRKKVDNFPIFIILIRWWNNKFNFPLPSNFLRSSLWCQEGRKWRRSSFGWERGGEEIFLLSRIISLENSLVSLAIIAASLYGTFSCWNKYPEIIKLHSSRAEWDRNLRMFAMADRSIIRRRSRNVFRGEMKRVRACGSCFLSCFKLWFALPDEAQTAKFSIIHATASRIHILS